MDKYKRYYGVIGFCAAIIILFFAAFKILMPMNQTLTDKKSEIEQKQEELNSQQSKLQVVQDKLKKIKDSIAGSQKKIYSPIESDLGNDTLFFTLYNDVIEMVHSNSVKIRNISYVYNPESDKFVTNGKDMYFVCDVNMELVSNYVNLGKLIQDIYQYPYYIKINELEVKPYAKDKKVLISNISLRLYAHTAPKDEQEVGVEAKAPALKGAETELPQ